MELETSHCDCASAKYVRTREYYVCINCGVTSNEPILVDNQFFEEVSHFSNPILTKKNHNKVHHSINLTLTKLDKKVHMSQETKFLIITRAYDLVGQAGNYIKATKIAFKEIFPHVDIGLDKFEIKKIKEQNVLENSCTIHCLPDCPHSYNNNFILKRKLKLKSIKERFKGKTVDELCEKINLSKSTYYRWQRAKYKHKTKDRLDDYLSRLKLITLDIHDFIVMNKDEMNGTQLHFEILYRFHQKISVNAINRHIKKYNEILASTE